jgi:branched-chain amino acid transport system permease protein
MLLMQAILSGLTQASVYAVVAVGLTVTFGVMRVVNFAHGEFLMLAMYGGYFAWKILNMEPEASVLLILPAAVICGLIFHKLAVEKLLKVHETSQMAATLAISMLIQNAALLSFSADYKMLGGARLAESISIAGAAIQMPQVTLGLSSLAVIAVLYFIVRRTELGLCLRAVSSSREGAILSGINVGRAYMLATVIGIGSLGVAGPLLVSTLYVTPYAGVLFTLKAFVIVIVGGLGSFEGALLGALLVGLTESVAQIWLPGSVAAAIPFLLLIIALLVRPEGLMGRVAFR